MIEIKNEESSNLNKKVRVVMRFSHTAKVYSVLLPLSWRIKKLKKFITHTFKDETNNNTINLYYGAKLLSDDDMILASVIKSKEDLIQLIVVVRKEENKNNAEDNDKKISIGITISQGEEKKEKLTSEDFEKLELYMYLCYKDILIKQSKLERANSPRREMVNRIPLMHNNFQNRVNVINEKNKMTLLDTHNPEGVDNYPIRDYFKIEVFFKLFLFFILFGVHMKGYNIPFFISLLVLYYWYYVYTDVNAFYEKKLNEIKLSQEEMSSVKILEYDSDEEQPYEKDYDDPDKRENNTINENINNIFRETQEQSVERVNQIAKDDQANQINNKVEVDDIQIENINEYNNDLQGGSGNINQNREKNDEKLCSEPEVSPKIVFDKEPEDITHLISKIENRKRKLSKEQKPEGFIQYYLAFGTEIIWTFLMSLFPLWCDEYEAQNAVIKNSNENQILTNQENTNSHHNLGTENMNNFTNQEDNMKNEDEVKRDKENKIFKNISFADNTQDFIKSEKVEMKSSLNDTKAVNRSEGDNTKYCLVEENENRTENEFEFSENINIDTLSYNEPLRKKFEKDPEEDLVDEQAKYK